MAKHSAPVVHSDPDVMGGTPVFVGTRVPFQTLLDYLEAGDPLSEFLEDFPTVSREQAVAALEQAKDALLARAPGSNGPGNGLVSESSRADRGAGDRADPVCAARPAPADGDRRRARIGRPAPVQRPPRRLSRPRASQHGGRVQERSHP